RRHGRASYGDLSSTSAHPRRGVKAGNLRRKRRPWGFATPVPPGGVEKVLRSSLSDKRSPSAFPRLYRSGPAVAGPITGAEVDLRRTDGSSCGGRGGNWRRRAAPS